jgi:hypothetical protein
MQMAGPDGPSLWICAAVIGLRKEKYGIGHAVLQVSAGHCFDCGIPAQKMGGNGIRCPENHLEE